MTTTTKPKGNKVWGCVVAPVAIFACLFLCVGAYYVGGYVMTRSVGSLYAQGDCATLLPIADQITRFFPQQIAPFTQDIPAQAKECRLYVQASDSYKKKQWSQAVADFEAYLKAYPKGVQREGARQSAADSLLQWSKEQQSKKDFAGAEKNLLKIKSSYANTTASQKVNQTLAELYIAWAKSLEASNNYALAEAKYNLAISTDPNPSAAGSPTEQAKQAYVDLHLNWARQLLGSKRYDEAVDHLNLVIKFLGPVNSTKFSNELAQAYIQWATSLSTDSDFEGALDKLSLAEKAASTNAVRDQIRTTNDSTLNLYSKSSGTQAKALMDSVARSVCQNRSAAKPSVPILGLDSGTKRALLYGVSLSPSSSVWARTPATSYYVACITPQQNTVQTCPYNGGYYIKRIATNWLVEVRNLLTGDVYRSTTLAGGSPESCPYVHTFTRGIFTHEHTGAPPSLGSLESWLSKYIR